MFQKVSYYFSLIKLSHTIFALPFALIGFFIAIHETNDFSWLKFILIILCMIFARSAAMSFNRYVDRDIDKLNPRTANREIPRGIITGKAALIFAMSNVLLFFITTYFINPLCFVLSPIALIVILGYSFTKRFTSITHFILGLSLSIAPIGSYIAVKGEFAFLPLLLSLLVLCWVAGFDIIYSLQDKEFDKNHHLKSIPAKLGSKNALIVSVILHIITTSVVIYIGYYNTYGIFYWIGAFIFIVLLIYQHSIIGATNLKNINIAFATTNGIASVIYAIFFILEIWQ